MAPRVAVLLVVGLVAVLLVAPASCSSAGRGPSFGGPAYGAAQQGKEAGQRPQPQVQQQAAAAPKKQQEKATADADAKAPPRIASAGKILNSLAEFEIVNEGHPKATGDLAYAAPTFMASIVGSLFAVSGQDNVTENLSIDGPYGIWSVDAEQRFFWSPVENGKPRVTIEGTADAPKSITIRGRFGGPSDSVASMGRIGTRGVVPRDMPLAIKAPTTCTYTWTDPQSFCHVIYSGVLTTTPAMGMDTTVGGFLEAGLWQTAFPWMKYAEVKCVLDLEGKGGPYERDCSIPSKSKGMTRIKTAPSRPNNKPVRIGSTGPLRP